MKLLIVFSLSAWMLAAADGHAKKAPVADGASATAGTSAASANSATSAASSRPAANLQIPAGAVKTGDGSYRFTDPQGKNWIYRKTPFGVSRLEDKPETAAAQTDEGEKRFQEVKATEDGDTIRFERPGPFGIYKWQRKKTELDAMEQTVWNRERARAAARQD